MEKKKLTRFIIIFAVIFVALIVGIILTGMTKSGGHEEIGVVMKDSVLHERYKINLFGLIEVNPAVISAFIVSGVLIVFAIIVRIFVIPKFKVIPGKFQMLLEQAGFLIETEENGKIALEMTASSEQGYYDVILMDIQMPVMDGYTAAKAIRSLPDSSLAGIPIIAMTANAFQEDIRKAGEVGMNGHIAKPLDIPSMRVTLQHVLKDPSR